MTATLHALKRLLAIAEKLPQPATHDGLTLADACAASRAAIAQAEGETKRSAQPPAIDGDTLRHAADRLDALERAHAQTCASVAAFVLDYRQGPHALPLDRAAATQPLVELLARIGAPDLHRFGIFPA